MVDKIQIVELPPDAEKVMLELHHEIADAVSRSFGRLEEQGLDHIHALGGMVTNGWHCSCSIGSGAWESLPKRSRT
jgi:hypothetical protein